MQISLKQSEIVSAIHGYIETQGINLSGKNVDISFTSGRKGNGLTADVNIYVGEKEEEEVVSEEVATEDAPEVVQEIEVTPVTEGSSLFG